MRKTVAFVKNKANVFFHIQTQCNLTCNHCYINPEQHGTEKLSLSKILRWLKILIRRSPAANLVLLGGEPTLHSDLAAVVKAAKQMGYDSITIDTNGYLFNRILERVTTDEVDYFSFSLDGPTARVNDAIRGEGCYDQCTAGIAQAKAKGFSTSVIYTVSRMNLRYLEEMVPLLKQWRVDHFFIQIIGLRGKSAVHNGNTSPLQLSRDEWLQVVPTVARTVTEQGILVTYPKAYLSIDEPFECAGKVADNYFVFPNGRVYRCPLCEDFPLHGLAFQEDQITVSGPINETDLFNLDIAEGCVMNKLIQPNNIAYRPDGRPSYRIACCLLKEHLEP